MDTSLQNKLKLLHIGADPEFDSHLIFQNYTVEINSFDNPFSVSQWISLNGLPDGIICEFIVPGSNGFEFFDFWIAQFDQKSRIPFILLDNKENPETTSRASQVKIDDIFVKSTKIETLLDRILILKESKSFKVVESETASSISKSYNTPFFKRIFDILLASILLLLISPILFLFIIAIRLETRGKAFSFSKRVGSGYKVFDYYKLRTMFANADKRLKEQAYLAQHHKDVINSDAVNLIHDQTFSGTDHINKKEVQDTFIKFENDARLTKVGQIIRKLGIDKLPILFNVIKGDMSIVGNRPLTMSEAELLTCGDWIDRLHGPAGITGLWYLKQVEKSAKKNPVERKSLDNKYFEIAKSRFSFFKDIWIIMKTIPAIFQ